MTTDANAKLENLTQMVEALVLEVRRLKSGSSGSGFVLTISAQHAADIVGCHPSKLSRNRREWGWINGVHFFKRDKGSTVLYNQPMIEDWLVNANNPHAHQRAIENFRRSLPSGKKKK